MGCDENRLTLREKRSPWSPAPFIPLPKERETNQSTLFRSRPPVQNAAADVSTSPRGWVGVSGKGSSRARPGIDCSTGRESPQRSSLAPHAWHLFLAILIAATLAASAAEPVKYRAARSVHWGWSAPAATLFYNEMIVEESTTGSYFMACGWNTGYFGIQELGDGKKVAIFSVWDPAKGDDPTAVTPGQRVELLHEGEGVRVKRFGGEGTGGQCMMDFDWAIGQTNKFLVRASKADGKTAYEGHLWLPNEQQWKHLVTFRTRTGDTPFNGFYSFIEDFRRDYKSVNETRTARFGNGWAKSTNGDWVSLRRARFTASGAEWESKENIDGRLVDGWFLLQTGGDIKEATPLRSWVEAEPLVLPPAMPATIEE